MYFKYTFLLGAYIYMCVCARTASAYQDILGFHLMRHNETFTCNYESLSLTLLLHHLRHSNVLSVPSRLRPKPLSPPSYFQFFLSTFPPRSTPNLINTFCEANKYCQRNCFYNYCTVSYNVSLFLENVSGKLLLSKIVSTCQPFF